MVGKKESKTAGSDSIRLHVLAKEFGVPSKLLVEEARKLNMSVKSHASVVSLGQADRLRAKLGGGKLLAKAGKAEKKKKKPRSSKSKSTAPKKAPPQTVSETENDVGVSGVVAPAVETPLPAKRKARTKKEPQPLPAGDLSAPPDSAPADLSFGDAPWGAADTVPPALLGTVDAPPPVAPPVVEALAAVVAPPEEEEKETPAEPSTTEALAETTAAVEEKTAEPGTSAAEVEVEEEPPAAKKEEIVEAEEKEKEAPSPKVLLAGPRIAPPVDPRTVSTVSKKDNRFGVVLAAEKAEKLHGPTSVPPRGPAARSVEAKSAESFTPQVSYPKVAGGGGGGRRDTGTQGGYGTQGQGGYGARRGTGGGGRRVMPRRGGRRGRRGSFGDDREGFRRKKRRRSAAPQPVVKREGPVTLTSPITVRSLSEGLGIKSSELIAKFLLQGRSININSIMLDDEAQLLALEFGREIVVKKSRDVEEQLLAKVEKPDDPADLRPRAPVVTVMGHVDHGKTSLLDKIRSSRVVDGEFGGITQRISAYKVNLGTGEVVFLDTPGHKAFTEMRARGANVTDIVVLVIAAEDGVMPQTLEAISHARAADKRIVVALNKCDRPDANPEKVKGELAAQKLFVEGYGGEVGCVEVSALTGKGVDELLERILLEAEMLELKANPNKPAKGTVVEAEKDQGRGIEATLLVEDGTLHTGDILICGHAYGRVRRMRDDTGRVVENAEPATPVLVTGLNEVPLSGERFYVMEKIDEAARIAEERAAVLRREGLVARRAVTLENLHSLIAEGEVTSLDIVLKVDVIGSLPPLRNALMENCTAEARVDVIHSGVGAVNETDVLLAEASNAVVIAFNVAVDPGARNLAEQRRVQLREHNVIYEAVSEARAALEGLLKPVETEVFIGRAEVRQTFKISRYGVIAGCYVVEGVLRRTADYHLLRDGEQLWAGKAAGLQRFKDDVREVRAGFECGLCLDGTNEVKVGDIIEAYVTKQVPRKLEDLEKEATAAGKD